MIKQPPFTITPEILSLSMKISEVIGNLSTAHLIRPDIELRRKNRLLTIQNSLSIEGNSLNLEQITALLEGHRVIGPKNDIQEVINAEAAYQKLIEWKAHSVTSFKQAHTLLLHKLTEDAGQWRQKQVGVLAGTKVAHIAPPPRRVASLMEYLFAFLKQDKQITVLIKACVFHYELEFIHPFSDGNGRMGRLWQQVILLQHHPIFEYICVEKLIKQHQQQYYNVLAECDSAGDSTAFISFMLDKILKALSELNQIITIKPLTSKQRLQHANEKMGDKHFSRKDYRMIHKNISSATASRDLSEGVKNNLLAKEGDKAKSLYKFKQ